jgi:hypothetical protein
MPSTTAYGYDGIALEVGDRVEIHPATYLWVRGARYGTIVRMSLTPNDRVRVKLDKIARDVSASADTFRRV